LNNDFLKKSEFMLFFPLSSIQVPSIITLNQQMIRNHQILI
jgi:hypothetical protein